MNRQVSSCTLSAFMCASTAVDGQLNFIDFRQEVNICYEQLFSKCRFVQLRAQTRQQTDSWILLHFGRKPSNVMNSSSNFQVSVVCFFREHQRPETNTWIVLHVGRKPTKTTKQQQNVQVHAFCCVSQA